MAERTTPQVDDWEDVNDWEDVKPADLGGYQPGASESRSAHYADSPAHQGFWSSVGSAVTAPWNLANNLDTITPKQVVEGVLSPVTKLRAGNVRGALGDVVGGMAVGKLLGGKGPEAPIGTRRVMVEPWRQGEVAKGGIKIPSPVADLLPTSLKWGAKAYNLLKSNEPKPYPFEAPDVAPTTPGWQILDKPSTPAPPAMESIRHPSGRLPSGRTPGVVTPKPTPTPRSGAAWQGMEQPVREAPPAVEPIRGELPSGRVPGKLTEQTAPPSTPAPEVTTAPVREAPAAPTKMSANEAGAQLAEALRNPATAEQLAAKLDKLGVGPSQARKMGEKVWQQVATKLKVDLPNEALRQDAIDSLFKLKASPAKSASELIQQFRSSPKKQAQGGVTLPHGPKGPSPKVTASAFPTKGTAKPKRRWYSPPRMPKTKPESQMPKMPR